MKKYIIYKKISLQKWNFCFISSEDSRVYHAPKICKSWRRIWLYRWFFKPFIFFYSRLLNLKTWLKKKIKRYLDRYTYFTKSYQFWFNSKTINIDTYTYLPTCNNCYLVFCTHFTLPYIPLPTDKIKIAFCHETPINRINSMIFFPKQKLSTTNVTDKDKNRDNESHTLCSFDDVEREIIRVLGIVWCLLCE